MDSEDMIVFAELGSLHIAKAARKLGCEANVC